MASSQDSYLDIADVAIAPYTFTTSAGLMTAIPTTNMTSGNYVLAMSSAAPFYIRKGDINVVATTSAPSLRVPAGVMYHLKYNPGERLSILGDGVGGTVSMTLMK